MTTQVKIFNDIFILISLITQFTSLLLINVALLLWTLNWIHFQLAPILLLPTKQTPNTLVDCLLMITSIKFENSHCKITICKEIKDKILDGFNFSLREKRKENLMRRKKRFWGKQKSNNRNTYIDSMVLPHIVILHSQYYCILPLGGSIEPFPENLQCPNQVS